MLLGIDVWNSTRTIEWQGKTIAFKPVKYFDCTFNSSSFETLSVDIADDALLENEAANADYKSTRILHSKYDGVNTVEAARQRKHLMPSQRQELAALFTKFDKLFSGKLGCYPHCKVHLELKDGAIPCAC